ncbi:unnamed protein product, partial [Prorocentrum cordatum]
AAATRWTCPSACGGPPCQRLATWVPPGAGAAAERPAPLPARRALPGLCPRE